ncbi:helix-turn-helix domain-containing protein [Salinivibrio kushneri]|uniref:helix-turn-helix domain-containing protein n=1 Tax=Salinivibrio kushneri TaxID=1908198 RepID=UPI0009884392|nr:hypothetical protein BZG12_00010 [Salinivibrio kushneri]
MIKIKLKEVLERHKELTGEIITYKELAERTGLARSTLESLGSRPTYNATMSTIDALCSALNCTPSELLEYSPSLTVDEKTINT